MQCTINTDDAYILSHLLTCYKWLKVYVLHISVVQHMQNLRWWKGLWFCQVFNGMGLRTLSLEVDRKGKLRLRESLHNFSKKLTYHHLPLADKSRRFASCSGQCPNGQQYCPVSEILSVVCHNLLPILPGGQKCSDTGRHHHIWENKLYWPDIISSVTMNTTSTTNMCVCVYIFTGESDGPPLVIFFFCSYEI